MGVLAATPLATQLLATSVAMTAVAGGYSAYSSIQQGNYQAAVAQQNAQIAENNRVAENTKGAADAEQALLASGRRVGAAVANQGASNVDVGFGTTKDTSDAMRSIGNLDAQTLQYNAQIKGLGFANQEEGFDAQASMDQAAGTNKAIGSLIGSASSITGDLWKGSLYGITPKSGS